MNKEKIPQQNKDINKPEGAEKNGDFWEKKYDDGNSIEKTILFCPSCGGQIVSQSEPIEAGEMSCGNCGFEGKTTLNGQEKEVA